MNSQELPDFARALVVVAHPDDAEFGMAGTVALWSDRGVEVTYVICTDGAAGAGDPEVDLARLPEIRQEEQREAAAVLGVREIHFLGHSDGGLRVTDDLRRELVRLIRLHRPDRVVCQNAVRNYQSIFGNHPDHLAAGQATIEAIYPYARNPYAYPELVEQGLQPYSVRELLVTGTESPDYFVDVTSTLERKFAALACHRSQHPPGVDFRPRVMERLAAAGASRGMAYAESFRRLSAA